MNEPTYIQVCDPPVIPCDPYAYHSTKGCFCPQVTVPGALLTGHSPGTVKGYFHCWRPARAIATQRKRDGILYWKVIHDQDPVANEQAKAGNVPTTWFLKNRVNAHRVLKLPRHGTICQ